MVRGGTAHDSTGDRAVVACWCRGRRDTQTARSPVVSSTDRNMGPSRGSNDPHAQVPFTRIGLHLLFSPRPSTDAAPEVHCWGKGKSTSFPAEEACYEPFDAPFFDPREAPWSAENSGPRCIGNWASAEMWQLTAGSGVGNGREWEQLEAFRGRGAGSDRDGTGGGASGSDRRLEHPPALGATRTDRREVRNAAFLPNHFILR